MWWLAILLSLLASQAFAQGVTTCKSGQAITSVNAVGTCGTASGGPTGPAGGVLGGSYPNPVFNSTNTAGNTMNNAFTVNNANGNTAWDMGIKFDPVFGGTFFSLEGVPTFTVAGLPACPASNAIVNDDTDGNCTAGTSPVGGGVTYCDVHCVAGAWKITGFGDAPWDFVVTPDGDNAHTVFSFFAPSQANVGASAFTAYNSDSPTFAGGVIQLGVPLAVDNMYNFLKNGPPALPKGLTLGTVAFASLPGTCTAGTELYCSDCKSVADGVTMASTCTSGGNGSVAVCKAANVWKCGQ